MHRAVAGLMLVIAAGACGQGSPTGAGTLPTVATVGASTAATTSTATASTTTAPATTTTPAPTTAPATTTTTTTIAAGTWTVIVVGDFGDGGAAELEVAAAMRQWVAARPESRVLITTGDNFYTADVAAAWDRPYGWLDEAGLAVWPVPGNHDIESPGQWQASVTAFGGFPRWRVRDIGGVAFVLLDSNQVRSAEQRAWFENTVATLGTRPWVAVFHYPWWSCGAHGSQVEVDEMWGDLLEQATLVLNGHDHGYQRFASESGWSVVTGGGGRRLHPMRACPVGTAPPVVAAAVHHFVAITADASGLLVEVVGVDGARIDTFVVELPS